MMLVCADRYIAMDVLSASQTSKLIYGKLPTDSTPGAEALKLLAALPRYKAMVPLICSPFSETIVSLL